jgi:hypothetical protein
MNRLTHYYIHVFQYLLFYVAGRAIGELQMLLKLLLVISCLDVVWTGYNWLYEKDTDLRHALASWFVLNLLSSIGVFLIIVNYGGILQDTAACCALVVIYIAATVADYITNPKLFFGIDKSSKI